MKRALIVAWLSVCFVLGAFAGPALSPAPVFAQPNPGIADPARLNGVRVRTGTTFTVYDADNNAGPVFTDVGTTMNAAFDGNVGADFYRPYTAAGNLTFEDSAGNDFGYFLDSGTRGTLVLGSSLVIGGSCTGCADPNAVSGPASATNEAVVLFDGTTGKLVKSQAFFTCNATTGNCATTSDFTVSSASGARELITNGLQIFSGAGMSLNDSAGAEQMIFGSLGEMRPKFIQPYGTGTGDVTMIRDGSGDNIVSFNCGGVSCNAHMDWKTATADEYVNGAGPYIRKTSSAFTLIGPSLNFTDTNVSISESGINDLSVTADGAVAATFSSTGLSIPGVFTSTVATGTAPVAVSSTTKVSNLNVDQVDGRSILLGAVTADQFGATAFGVVEAGATTMTVTGAVTTDGCTIGLAATITKDSTYSCAVTAPDTVTVYRQCGVTPGPCANDTSAIWNVFVIR